LQRARKISYLLPIDFRVARTHSAPARTSGAAGWSLPPPRYQGGAAADVAGQHAADMAAAMLARHAAFVPLYVQHRSMLLPLVSYSTLPGACRPPAVHRCRVEPLELLPLCPMLALVQMWYDASANITSYNQ
jgi:hypothetical protein